eukprot:s88_g1.t1
MTRDAQKFIQLYRTILKQVERYTHASFQGDLSSLHSQLPRSLRCQRLCQHTICSSNQPKPAGWIPCSSCRKCQRLCQHTICSPSQPDEPTGWIPCSSCRSVRDCVSTLFAPASQMSQLAGYPAMLPVGARDCVSTPFAAPTSQSLPAGYPAAPAKSVRDCVSTLFAATICSPSQPDEPTGWIPCKASRRCQRLCQHTICSPSQPDEPAGWIPCSSCRKCQRLCQHTISGPSQPDEPAIASRPDTLQLLPQVSEIVSAHSLQSQLAKMSQPAGYPAALAISVRDCVSTLFAAPANQIGPGIFWISNRNSEYLRWLNETLTLLQGARCMSSTWDIAGLIMHYVGKARQLVVVFEAGDAVEGNEAFAMHLQLFCILTKGPEYFGK